MYKLLIPISSKKALLFAIFLVLYEFLTYIANDMIMPGMITVVHFFNAPESTVATSLTVYLLGGASLQIILGPLSDIYGRRPLMLLGACLFFIFTLFIACTQTMNQFLIARFFQGMGLCFIGVIGYATIQELFAEMDAIRLIAIMANAAILAPLLGPLLGAVVIHYASWQFIFIMIALFSVIALWGLWKYMPETIGQNKHDTLLKVNSAPTLSNILKNYQSLFTNLPFCFSSIALGVLGIPCIAWIALAPIMMIAQAKLTVIQYGLWQLPIFGATILGNWWLHHLTYKHEIKKIIYIGCVIITVGLILTALLPYCYGTNYIYLIPGIILYFFALSIITAPLNRYCLYVTNVSKGTASALISLSIMVVGSIGIEFASICYKHHSNLNFGLYCNATGGLFLLFLGLAFYLDKKNPDGHQRGI